MAAGELGLQRRAIGREVGETAAGQLRHLVERLKILVARGADAEAHSDPFAAMRSTGQCRQGGALGQAVDDEEFVGRMDQAAARAHGVDHRHAAGGDIVAVAHPAGRPPGNGEAEIGAGRPDQLEQLRRARIDRLGRAVEAAMDMDLHVMLGRDGGDHRIDRRLGTGDLLLRARGRKLTRRMASSGTTLFGPPPSIRAGFTARPGPRIVLRRRAISAAATMALRPSSGLRPAWALLPCTTIEKLPVPPRAPGQSAVGQGGLIGERGDLAARRLGEQRGGRGRAGFLVRIDHHLIADAGGERRRLDRLQRRKHGRDAALHVGDTGAVEHVVVQEGQRLEGVIDRIDRVHMAGEQHLHRRIGPDGQVEMPAMGEFGDGAIEADTGYRGRLDESELTGQRREGVAELARHGGDSGHVAGAAVDRGPVLHLGEHMRVVEGGDRVSFDG